MRKNIYRFLMYVAAFIVGTSPVFLCGCSGAAAGSAAVASLFEDENVQMVKNGHPYAYPDITYGKAFGGFFAVQLDVLAERFVNVRQRSVAQILLEEAVQALSCIVGGNGDLSHN